MGASERVSALRRARERQARIEAATNRTIKAQTLVDRAVEARRLAIERYDERVADAEATYEAEVAELARTCRSAEAAAEILGCSVTELRRVVKAERERGTSAQTATGGSDVDS